MLGIVFGIFLVAMILALPMGVAMGVATVVPQLINSSFAGNMNYIIQAMISGLNTTPHPGHPAVHAVGRPDDPRRHCQEAV